MTSRSMLSSKSGFTLIEVAVSAVVLAVVCTTLTMMIMHSVNAWSRGTSQQVANNSAAEAIQKLYQDVRVGSAASLASGHLAVTVPALVVDSHGQSYYDSSVGSTTYSYYISNGDLYRQIGSATPTIFTRGITSITFSVNPKGNMVSVTATGHFQAGKQQQDQSDPSVSAQIVLRNFSG